MRQLLVWTFFIHLCFAPEIPAVTERYVLALCGSGGNEDYQQKFHDWGRRLERLVSERLGIPRDKIFLLMEREEENQPSSTLLNIQDVCSRLKHRLSPDDELLVILIGHGSYLQGKSKFHIPGPDLTATRLQELLNEIPSKRQIVINSTSGSAGFINIMSGPKRIVCAATKSAEEKNATEFMEFFLQGLEQNHSDTNRDQRITLLEACRYAAMQTTQWYTGQGVLATEHALIDCNGDRLGERLYEVGGEQASSVAVPPESDTGIASRIFLLDESFPQSAPQEQIDAYLAVLEEIEEWKTQKEDTEEIEYYQKLESLLLRAARIHRDIRNGLTQ